MPIRQVQAAGIVEFLNAPSLPGARKDIENLQAVFGPRIRKLLPGRDAYETEARKLLDQRGLLFMATHGQNDADRPLSSFLLFHPDRENDGYLTAQELYARRVASDLVVLSACYSGLADRSPLPGDDLFGLERALLHSGARTVVAGIWDVYDGTGPELMNGFFHELAAGKPVPQALANSQRAFLSRLRQSSQVEPWLHPYFWAVYKTAGDDRTRMSAN
jgi:CHAT domain-containing protein